jgi:hypothetical protein
MNRVDAYILKMPNEATMTAILTALKDGMETRLSNEFMNMESIEALVRGTIAGITGVTAPTKAQCAAYQAACKQMYRFDRHWVGGTQLDADMAAIIAKWSLRGLDGAVLSQLAYEIFHWSPPGP